MTTMHWITVLAVALGIAVAFAALLRYELHKADKLNREQFRQVTYLMRHLIDTEIVLAAYKSSAPARPAGVSKAEEARTFDDALKLVAEIIGAEFLGPKLTDFVNEDTL